MSNAIIGAVNDAVDWTESTAEDVSNAIIGAVNDAVDWTEGAVEDAGEWLGNALENEANWWEGMVNASGYGDNTELLEEGSLEYFMSGINGREYENEYPIEDGYGNEWIANAAISELDYHQLQTRKILEGEFVKENINRQMEEELAPYDVFLAQEEEACMDYLKLEGGRAAIAEMIYGYTVNSDNFSEEQIAQDYAEFILKDQLSPIYEKYEKVETEVLNTISDELAPYIEAEYKVYEKSGIETALQGLAGYSEQFHKDDIGEIAKTAIDTILINGTLPDAENYYATYPLDISGFDFSKDMYTLEIENGTIELEMLDETRVGEEGGAETMAQDNLSTAESLMWPPNAGPGNAVLSEFADWAYSNNNPGQVLQPGDIRIRIITTIPTTESTVQDDGPDYYITTYYLRGTELLYSMNDCWPK